MAQKLSFIKDKPTTTPNKRIVIRVDKQLENYIGLWASAHVLSKAEISKRCLSDWKQKHIINYPEIDLVVKIANRLVERWKIEVLTGSGVTIEQFKETVTMELKDRGVSSEFITKILRDFEYGKSNSKK